jgi:phosphatidylserine/phosphatidylglycerophosphate/cardiolipin synthase-like enzyme
MGTTYTHSKITLNPDAFRIQTANLTKSSFESNREHFFFSSNPAIHQNLKELFARDREGIPLSSDQFHPNLVVCPINCRVVIEALLSTAKESILIQTQYILDENILQLLRQQPEHIALNIIIADTIENAELTHYF